VSCCDDDDDDDDDDDEQKVFFIVKVYLYSSLFLSLPVSFAFLRCFLL